MQQRDDYMRRLRDELEHLNGVASAWADSARTAPYELHLVRERQLALLRAYRERAAARLLEAEAALDSTADRAIAAVHEAWIELREAYRAARPHFEHGRRADDT
jgi:hypothetical protein